MAIQIDLGKLSLTKGTWSGATTYEKDDVVQYADGGTLSTYIAVAGSTNQAHQQVVLKTHLSGNSWQKVQTKLLLPITQLKLQILQHETNAYFVDSTANAITITLHIAQEMVIL